MGKIVVSENVTLDGVIQDPAGDEGFRAGGWVGLIKDSPRLGKLALHEALGAEAFLLGRRSYEWLAARWPSRSGGLADRLNSLPKVRRVLDPRRAQMEQLDRAQGRRA
jgi:dihydrofolate reductase